MCRVTSLIAAWIFVVLTACSQGGKDGAAPAETAAKSPASQSQQPAEVAPSPPPLTRVIGDRDGWVMYSGDGKIWRPQSLVEITGKQIDSYQTVRRDPLPVLEKGGIFATVVKFLDNNLWVSSRDGETWQTEILPFSGGVIGFLICGDHYVVAQNDRIRRSTDGKQWSDEGIPPSLPKIQTHLHGNLELVCIGTDLIVAPINADVASGYVHISRSGGALERHAPAWPAGYRNIALLGLAAGNGVVVAVVTAQGSNDPDNSRRSAVFVSADGITWSEAQNAAVDSRAVLDAVGFVGGQFLVSGHQTLPSGEKAVYGGASPDGKHWKLTPVNEPKSEPQVARARRTQDLWYVQVHRPVDGSFRVTETHVSFDGKRWGKFYTTKLYNGDAADFLCFEKHDECGELAKVTGAAVRKNYKDERIRAIANLEYKGVIGKATVQMRDGKAEGKGESRYDAWWARIEEKAIAFGDVDGDGQADAVVPIAYNMGGNMVDRVLAVVLNKNGHWTVVSVADVEGQRTPVEEVTVLPDGTILARVITHGPGDPMCCPSKERTVEFRFKDGTLKQLVSKKKPAAPPARKGTGKIYLREGAWACVTLRDVMVMLADNPYAQADCVQAPGKIRLQNVSYLGSIATARVTDGTKSMLAWVLLQDILEE